MAVQLQARRFTEARAHHGEGATWDAAMQRWLWVDMLAGRVMVSDASGATTAQQLPDRVAALVRPHVEGGHIVVGEHTVWWTDLDDEKAFPIRLSELPIASGCRANEGACDASGRLAVGSMAYDESVGVGNVWTFRDDGSLATALAGTTISNGTVFESDSAVVFADSATGQVCRFDVAADGAWTNRRVLIEISLPGTGPDGICMDVEGGIWVALWDGARAQRWSAEGVLTHEVLVPTPRATSVALGGPLGRTLFITTSAVDLPTEDVDAGACFTVEVATPGQPIRPCRIPARPSVASRLL